METPTLLPLAARVAIIQSQCITVLDDGVNPTLGNSRYIKLDRIRRVLRPHWLEHKMGVAVLPPEKIAQVDGFPRPVITCQLMITCCVTGERMLYPVQFMVPQGNRGTNECQIEGIAATYAERYAIKMAFGISAGDEDDAQSGGGDIPEEPATSSRCPWSTHMDYAWSDLDAGYGDGKKLGSLDADTMNALYLKNPSNSALMAWSADMILKKLQQNNSSWRDYLSDHEDLDVPRDITDCTAEHLLLARQHIGKTYPRKK